MAKKVLIIGDDNSANQLVISALREQFGDDVEIHNEKTAMDKGLGPEDFANIPNYKITPVETIPEIQTFCVPKCGRAKRRERRKNYR